MARVRFFCKNNVSRYLPEEDQGKKTWALAGYMHDVLPPSSLLGYDRGCDRFAFDNSRDGVFDKELDLSNRTRERSRDPDVSDSSSFCSRVSESSLSPGLVAPSAPTSPAIPSTNSKQTGGESK